MQDWIVAECTPRSDVAFPWCVKGVNLNNGSFFSWHVPSIEDPRYDIGGARFEVDARKTPTSIAVFQAFDNEREANEMFANLRAQGFGWVRMQVADSLSNERFAPVVRSEIGSQDV